MDAMLPIGRRLRRAREARGMSLDDVARATGLTKGFLSQVERDLSRASVASLVRICEAVGLRVGALFEPADADLVRRDERPPIEFGGEGVREFLLSPSRERRLQVIASEVAPGGGSGEDPYTLRSEAEFVHVQRGALEVTVDGRAYRLEAGDSLTFSARTAHAWRNPSGDEPADVLWVLAPALS